MKRNQPAYRIDEVGDVIGYIREGYHAFVACDVPRDRNSFVESLQVALDGQIQECVFGGELSNRTEFLRTFVYACQHLVRALGVPRLERASDISSSLNETMELYCHRNRQGYLILSDMDRVFDMQDSFEIEGSLRSVMQIYDDVAVVVVGSNDRINQLVGDYDRPFYMSFRVFRL